jgi:hypothetical protein
MGCSIDFTSRWWMGFSIYNRRTTFLNNQQSIPTQVGPEKEHHNGSKK